ncbi:hypothetical protein [Paenarthrobacter aurescens]|uniref:Uncharacterized protein n=1 Tax=Paenarthrobacter aurescens TaxID=43663 RepID=A0A4Y3NMX1_PAEAU|nr:hypothetical protein [Paenarthrobacter aurescens]UKA49497.1 hypothetical protein LFT48_18990 [Arthrobacter sp. FW305-123]MDO6145118.1 hypothetical protein [Paenarthrobacter aurescens]MDO6148963.1 hypothetical protein [Paenarthrobacter aurescens]MDO6160209.1 hypothetical protein [Paenarthrobacter aurescens]MDO6164068.1 hypothetical protein [Paenarthrobacter aurescens]
MEIAAVAAEMHKKLKAIKGGDNVRIGGEVFQVRAVMPQDGSRNIGLELQAHDGGSVTLIGLPTARLQLTARAS